jgi:hypothetical protein
MKITTAKILTLSIVILITNLSQAAPSDYNNDGLSDFLLRHEGFPGTWDIAYMNGPSSSTVVPIANLPVGDGYYTAATADFDGDGDTDVMLRDALGTWFMYIIENGSVINNAALPIFPTPGDVLSTKGDFDGDGKTDFVTRNSLGVMTIYYMNGVSIKNSQIISGMPGFWFRAETSGDYDGDGKPEWLFRKVTGFLKLEWWYYDVDFDSHTASGVHLPDLDSVANMAWVGVTSKDYDNDGDEEPLLRSNLNLKWMLVQLDGTSVGSADILPIDTWGYVPAGGVTAMGMDMDGDGYKEIVLRQTSYNTYKYFELDGANVIDQGPVNLPAIPYSRISQVK